MMDVAELGAILRASKSDLFRLETLAQYAVPSDGGDFARYLAGAPGPDMARKAAWQQRLRADRARGLRRWRVYVAHEPLGPYARFECEWGHAPNAALEEIRVLPAVEIPDAVPLKDFWLLDDQTVVLMHYSEAGQFTGAEILPDSELRRYLAARDAAWAAAEDFTSWWAAHPQYSRHGQAA